jgi:hypothetical protein
LVPEVHLPVVDDQIRLTDFGGVGDSATDSRAALVAADAAAQAAGMPILVTKGSYRFSADVTVRSPVKFTPGAVLKPDAGVTVSLTGGVTTNGLYRIFDQSLGGLCEPLKVAHLHPAWWGPTGSADDSQTWNDMLAACAAKSHPAGLGGYTQQRILVPAGESRLWQVDIKNFHLEGNGRSGYILPPATATAGDPTTGTGYVVNLQGSTSVSGVVFGDGNKPGITVVFWTGARVHMSDSLVSLRAENTIGIWPWLESVDKTLEPVLHNVVIDGPSVDYPDGTPTGAALSAIGIRADSADGQMTNCGISNVGTGIELNRAQWLISNVHVWQAQKGITGSGLHTRLSNVNVANCYGWGIDLRFSYDFVIDSTCYIWDNGRTVPNTGGVKLSGSGSEPGQDVRIDAIFNDNYGTGLFLVSMDNVYGSPLITCKRTQLGDGNPPRGTTGVFVDRDCRNVELKVRTGELPVVTGMVVDNRAPALCTVDYPATISGTAKGGSTAEDGANTWAKLATFRNSFASAELNAVYAFATSFGAAGENGLLSLRLRNNSGAPDARVQVLAMGGFSLRISPTSFKVTSNGVGEPYELWVKKNTAFINFTMDELVSSPRSEGAGPGVGWVVSYNRGAKWQSATPTGTAGNWTSNMASPAAASTSTVTSGGSLALEVFSTPVQIFTGTLNHTLRLPAANIVAGQTVTVLNNSTGVIAVQTNSLLRVGSLAAGQAATFTAKVDEPNTAAAWDSSIPDNYSLEGHTHVAGDVIGAAAFVAAPATPTSPGTLNQIARGQIVGVDHLFVCTATNVWKAVPLSVTTW